MADDAPRRVPRDDVGGGRVPLWQGTPATEVAEARLATEVRISAREEFDGSVRSYFGTSQCSSYSHFTLHVLTFTVHVHSLHSYFDFVQLTTHNS